MFMIILLVIFLSFCCYRYARIYIARTLFISRVKKLHITPQNALFAFDLHGTILKANKLEIFKILIHDLPKLPFSIFVKILFWDLALKLSTGTFMIKQALIILNNENPKAANTIEHMAVKIMKAYTLTPHIKELLRELTHNGYKLYIASSIWQEGFDELIKKYPELKELFSGAYISCENNNYIHKPEQIYYAEFNEYLKQHHEEHEHILFFDDKYTNIQAIPKRNWYGYVFKNQADFEQVLITIGALKTRHN